MPKCFKDTYPTTRVVTDCTELFIEKKNEMLEVFERLFTFNRRHRIVADEKFRLKLKGSRGVFLNPKSYTLVNSDLELCPLTPPFKAI